MKNLPTQEDADKFRAMLERTAKSRLVNRQLMGMRARIYDVAATVKLEATVVDDPDEFNRQEDARVCALLENLMAEANYRHENKEHF
jgi:hypothetical protein